MMIVRHSKKHVSHSTKHMLQKKYERQENIIYLLDNCRSSRVIIWLYEHVLGSLSFFVASSSSWSLPTTTSWLSWPPIRWSSAICHGFPSGNTCCLLLLCYTLSTFCLLFRVSSSDDSLLSLMMRLERKLLGGDWPFDIDEEGVNFAILFERQATMLKISVKNKKRERRRRWTTNQTQTLFNCVYKNVQPNMMMKLFLGKINIELEEERVVHTTKRSSSYFPRRSLNNHPFTRCLSATTLPLMM